MRERSEARGPAIVDVLVRYREQRDRACVLDEPKREKKVAKLAAGERRELDRIDQRFALESFVTWAKRRRADVEREAPFLDRLAERDAQRISQRTEHDVRQAVGQALNETRAAERARQMRHDPEQQQPEIEQRRAPSHEDEPPQKKSRRPKMRR